jgi:hypothetical protein
MQQMYADYGDYPKNYESIIKSYMELRLKDPEAAQYKFIKQPKKSWLHPTFNASDSTFLYGYSLCVLINGKNSFGAYTGYSFNYFMIKNEEVIIYHDGAQRSSFVERLCHDFI